MNKPTEIQGRIALTIDRLTAQIDTLEAEFGINGNGLTRADNPDDLRHGRAAIMRKKGSRNALRAVWQALDSRRGTRLYEGALDVLATGLY